MWLLAHVWSWERNLNTVVTDSGDAVRANQHVHVIGTSYTQKNFLFLLSSGCWEYISEDPESLLRLYSGLRSTSDNETALWIQFSLIHSLRYSRMMSKYFQPLFPFLLTPKYISKYKISFLPYLSSFWRFIFEFLLCWFGFLLFSPSQFFFDSLLSLFLFLFWLEPTSESFIFSSLLFSIYNRSVLYTYTVPPLSRILPFFSRCVSLFFEQSRSLHCLQKATSLGSTLADQAVYFFPLDVVCISLGPISFHCRHRSFYIRNTQVSSGPTQCVPPCLSRTFVYLYFFFTDLSIFFLPKPTLFVPVLFAFLHSSFLVREKSFSVFTRSLFISFSFYR